MGEREIFSGGPVELPGHGEEWWSGDSPWEGSSGVLVGAWASSAAAHRIPATTEALSSLPHAHHQYRTPTAQLPVEHYIQTEFLHATIIFFAAIHSII